MAFDAHKNFAISTVATAPSPATSGTSLVVTTGEGTRFPAVSFNAVVWPAGSVRTPANSEVVRVTNISTDTFTITRTQESSSARTIIVGDYIAAAITAKTVTDMETQLARPVVLFDSTLGADTASIDTGAGGIAAGYDVLEIFAVLRTDDAAARASVDVTLNNDTGANYDRQIIGAVTGTAFASPLAAGTKWSIDAHGSGGSASYPAVARITFPSYTATTFFKVGEMTNVLPDATTTNMSSEVWMLGYRSTTAISRMKIAGQGAAKLVTGSRLLIFGQ